MATITFTDGTGAVTLSNGKAGPGSRFSQWTPSIDRVSDRRFALGTGIAYEYLFREDFTATFQIEHLPLTQLQNASRFIRWALQGNTFTLNTADAANRIYVCRLRPDTVPSLTMTDRVMLEYVLDVSVISAATPTAFLTCEYT